jgi:glutathione S-transferase
MYTLIGSPKTRAIRVIWMLEELGLDYDIDPADPRSDDILAINPSGKVPALKAGDDIIIDSVAICQYLADRHGQFTYPAGSIERARQDSWTFFALDEVDSALWFFAKNTFVLPKELRSKTAREACRFEFDRALTFLDRRLGDRAYVMGDQFTIPDLILGHCAGWAVNGAKWSIPEGRVADYVSRVRSRPACIRALEIRERY